MKFAASGALILLLTVLTGCSRGPEAEHGAAAPGGDAAPPELAASVRLDLLRAAYGRLSTLEHTRQTRTEQLNPEGAVIATADQTIRLQAGGNDTSQAVVTEQTTGAFEFGWLGRFAADPSAEPTAFPLEEIIPAEPAFLSARNRDDFTYRLASPTRLGPRVVQVLDVQARDSDQPVRSARVFFDPATGEALALTVERVNPALLFHERTAVHVQLRADGWLPDRTVVNTRISLPLAPARRFRLTTEYGYPGAAPPAR